MIEEPFALPRTPRANTPVVDAVRGFVFSSGRAWFNEHGLLDQQRELGRIVSSANNGRFLETIGRLAGGLGVAPWTPLKSLHKVWLRSNRGGAAAVFRLGERAARIELWRVPMASSSFFRTSMCGALEAGLGLFRPSASVVETQEATHDDDIVLRASW